MEDIIKHLRARGYKVTEEYDGTGQRSKVSGEFPPKKTLWEWLQLLIIPLVLLVIGSLFSYQQNQTSLQVSERQHETDLQIAADQQRAATLTAYIDDISNLLLNNKLSDSKQKKEVMAVARVRTLTTLRQLDPNRKGLLIQFLFYAQLIGFGNADPKASPIIDLDNADLSGANLHGASLDNIILSGANLSSANLSGAFLDNADFCGANLSGADLLGADLSGAIVTQEQLAKAKNATMPSRDKLSCF